MDTLRENKGSIMAMLEAFVLDPLSTWFASEESEGRMNDDDKDFFVKEKKLERELRPEKRKGYFREVDKEAILKSGRPKKILNRVESKVYFLNRFRFKLF
jgi:phosphatidylinositol kinase/protein kinase (PI-3  family)